jgi:hypothetical protein
MSDLYATDILAWSDEQAARLRRIAAADRLNDASPDWPNIIEENPEPALDDSSWMRDGTRLRPPAAPDARH